MLQINARNADYHAHLGYIQFALGNYADAKRPLEMARRWGRHDEADSYIYCLCLKQSGDRAAALENTRRLVEVWPSSARNVGLYAETLKKFGVPRADVVALKAAAASCISVENTARALEWLGHAQKLAPRDGSLWSLFAAAHRVACAYDKAEQCIRNAIELGETSWRTRNILGLILQETCRPAEAFREFKKASGLGSTDPILIGNAIMAMHYTPETRVDLIRAEIDRYANAISRGIRPSKHRNRRYSGKALRVGILSGTIHRHPAFYLSLSALENLDKQKVQFFAYCNGGMQDDYTQRLKNVCHAWRDIAADSDHEVAEIIRADDLDILIDMAGSTQGRPGVIARKPAPVQVKWVGGLYNTTGMPAVDWLLADAAEVPESDEQHYSENIYRMPDGYVVYGPPDYAPRVNEAPCVSNGHVTFCSFNNPAKVNEVIAGVWSRILGETPDSRLILKGRGYTSSAARNLVHGWFGKHGIDKGRVVMEPAAAHRELLDTYNRSDIALDTWPYSGGLTTCEALWMGNPVVTLPGPTFAGRHSASHLTNVGRTEWIADSEDAYVDIAVSLVRDQEALRETRQSLRREVAASPLCDAEKFARNFETALLEMFEAS
ncbi:hypothetical protein [Hyphobacterium sp.]|uniref:O-linked N-acetylglucosamine transferase, SPINDLY family protein n=1 Tax=Hyphobacterium sp. TaxID=2004662 RepID=UPI003B51C50A